MSFTQNYEHWLLKLLIIALLAGLYLMPTLLRRFHHGRWDRNQLALNLLFGWTIFGWWLSWKRKTSNSRLKNGRNPYHIAMTRTTISIIFILLSIVIALSIFTSPESLTVVVVPPAAFRN